MSPASASNPPPGVTAPRRSPRFPPSSQMRSPVAASSTHNRPCPSTTAAPESTRVASETVPPVAASVCGSVAASSPRLASSAYRPCGPAKASSPSAASGIGRTAAPTSKVAPSTRRSEPVLRFTT